MKEGDPKTIPWKPILLMAVCTFAGGFGALPTQLLVPGNVLGAMFVTALVFFGVYVAVLDNVVITPLLIAISGLGV